MSNSISDSCVFRNMDNAYSRRCLAVALALGVSFLTAHPNHNATQRSDAEPVPATEPAPAGARVSIRIDGDRRVIESNGLPDHATGRFPNRDNPNEIRAQNHRFTVPVHPVANREPSPLVAQPFGIAVNGVLFDPGTAEYWHNDRASGWRYDAKGDAFSLGLDTNNAHVQPNGAYHYHGIPNDLLTRLASGRPAMTLLGWAADGFPIYGVWGHRAADNPGSDLVRLASSYQLKSGSRPTAGNQPGGTPDGIFVEDFAYIAGHGDLDECSGRFGVTPEFPDGNYYYVLTEDFPFVPRAFRGTPDPSFKARGRPAGPGGRGRRRGPPGPRSEPS